MMITAAQILRAVPETNKARLEDFVKAFNEWSETFGLTTKARIVHFLAQCWHESACLRYTEEIASGRQYEGRRDLGNTQPGDGPRFKGRGYIQLTGRANYQAYARSGFCNGDLMAHPEWVAKSPGNVKASLWFWWRNKLSALADADDGAAIGEDIVTRITRRVNGGTNGLAQRKYYYRRFRKEFGL